MKRIHYYVHSPRFDRAYNLANTEQKIILKELIDGNVLFKLKKAVDDLLANQFDFYSVADLRRAAKRKCIPNYYHMTQQQLIESLKNVYRDTDEASSPGQCNQSKEQERI